MLYYHYNYKHNSVTLCKMIIINLMAKDL